MLQRSANSKLLFKLYGVRSDQPDLFKKRCDRKRGFSWSRLLWGTGSGGFVLCVSSCDSGAFSNSGAFSGCADHGSGSRNGAWHRSGGGQRTCEGVWNYGHSPDKTRDRRDDEGIVKTGPLESAGRCALQRRSGASAYLSSGRRKTGSDRILSAAAL